jgi:hypothetical protein
VHDGTRANFVVAKGQQAVGVQLHRTVVCDRGVGVQEFRVGIKAVGSEEEESVL